MRSERRPDPVIPDHEVLRRIGGGAYGEVWLARAVTGALRAVKVVWREDFDDERGFEREFEGIQKFEPVSRDHPGLMNILHVGRSDGEATFYYCVMELGDDVLGEGEINPIEYEPRTLRTDIKTAAGKPLPVDMCIDVGLNLAEALEHLHAQGLAHRDVKPSNVIFVDGKAKLADIGLVAPRGQMTFVGTEGFVPPEGPGSARADIYSLGKVLYECATGKDRLDFPELPDDLPHGAERKRWLALNEVICAVCEPRASKRWIQTAGELAEALRALKRGRRPRRHVRIGAWATVALLAAFAVAVGWKVSGAGEWKEWVNGFMGASPPAPEDRGPVFGLVKIVSYPEGADVFDENGRKIGTTPTVPFEVEVGKKVRMTVRKNGYRPFVVNERVDRSAVAEPRALGQIMQVFAPPVDDQVWTDQLGMRYQPVGASHVSSGLVPMKAWMRFAAESGWKGPSAKARHTESGEAVEVALVDPKGAAAYCAWLAENGVRDGYLTDEFQARPEMVGDFDVSKAGKRAIKAKLRPFHVVVDPVRFARLEVASVPSGADVYIDDVLEGTVDGSLRIDRLRPGGMKVRVVLEGYRPKILEVNLAPGETKRLDVRLARNQSVVFNQPWKNSLGMSFVPVGPELMAGAWETRVRDYETFVKENDYSAPLKPDFEQGPDHPVVFVSRDDAEAFCRWLTERERASEWIAETHVYRLPTDLEWSGLVELDEDAEASPAERSARAAPVFPWGFLWPPGSLTGLVGNLADESALSMPGFSKDRTISGYNDGVAATAPVGSFPANSLGIHDLSGNVHEWVSDDYGHRSKLGVLRGGGWNTYQEENLYSGARNAAPSTFHDNIYGFRVMLARVPREEEPAEGDVVPPAIEPGDGGVFDPLDQEPESQGGGENSRDSS
jgi:formylglycine-generating enzyme required for sulfatase activity